MRLFNSQISFNHLSGIDVRSLLGPVLSCVTLGRPLLHGAVFFLLQHYIRSHCVWWLHREGCWFGVARDVYGWAHHDVAGLVLALVARNARSPSLGARVSTT